jgi:hypothetical protein
MTLGTYGTAPLRPADFQARDTTVAEVLAALKEGGCNPA